MENVDKTVHKYTPTDVLPADLSFVLKGDVFNIVLNVLILDANLISLTFVQILHVQKILITVYL